MVNETRQITAVLKELQKHEAQQDIEAQREDLIKAIAETTGKPISLVREKFRKARVKEEFILEMCIVFGAVIAVLVFAIGLAILSR